MPGAGERDPSRRDDKVGEVDVHRPVMVVEFYECNAEMALIQQHGGSRSLAATDERACVRIYTSDDVTRDDYN